MNIFFRGLLPLVLLVANVSVKADPEDSWNVLLGTSLTRDSNLYRLPAGQAISDQITGVFAGLKVNKRYALQTFVVDALVTDYKFKNNSLLDNIGKNASAAWLWSLTPRLHGDLSVSYNEGLLNYSDYKPGTLVPGVSKNSRKTTTERFDIEWGAFGGFHLLSGVNHSEVTNSASIYQPDNYSSDSVEYGVKYVLPSSSQMTIIGRNTSGEYPNREFTGVTGKDNRYTQQDVEVRFLWVVSDISKFNGRLAHINREHEHTTTPNYSGIVGSLDYSLDFSGKVRFIANYTRDLVSAQDSFSTYALTNSFRMTPIWQMTTKTTLRANFVYDKREYKGAAPILTLFPTYGGYEDTLRQKSLSFDWMPLRTLTLSSSVQRNTRDSTFQFGRRDFASDIVYFSANLSF